jgi:heparosan-N-sulfate-glucuronate 5-epimerase
VSAIPPTRIVSRSETTELSRLDYYRRIAAAYLMPCKSQLAFWHETPELNDRTGGTELGEYYMLFRHKADYAGPYDSCGIPILNYHGRIGLQYNPIAIAQYALGNYNLFRRTGDSVRRHKFLEAANWLVHNQELNSDGVAVWNHHFDWEYRTPLKAPWYSGLAQGQGISVLVRAHHETGDCQYLQSAEKAFYSFLITVDQGGVTCFDEAGDTWFEEYIASPPTHILNGFIWASWGILDYYLATRESEANKLFVKSVATLAKNLWRYDIGYWSLYEQSGTRMRMLASPFYHSLHVVQLQVMYQLTGNDVFQVFADRWGEFLASHWKRSSALIHKSIFKVCYY